MDSMRTFKVKSFVEREVEITAPSSTRTERNDFIEEQILSQLQPNERLKKFYVERDKTCYAAANLLSSTEDGFGSQSIPPLSPNSPQQPQQQIRPEFSGRAELEADWRMMSSLSVEVLIQRAEAELQALETRWRKAKEHKIVNPEDFAILVREKARLTLLLRNLHKKSKSAAIAADIKHRRKVQPTLHQLQEKRDSKAIDSVMKGFDNLAFDTNLEDDLDPSAPSASTTDSQHETLTNGAHDDVKATDTSQTAKKSRAERKEESLARFRKETEPGRKMMESAIERRESLAAQRESQREKDAKARRTRSRSPRRDMTDRTDRLSGSCKYNTRSRYRQQPKELEELRQFHFNDDKSYRTRTDEDFGRNVPYDEGNANDTTHIGRGESYRPRRRTLKSKTHETLPPPTSPHTYREWDSYRPPPLRRP